MEKLKWNGLFLQVSRLSVECQTEPSSVMEVPKKKLKTVLSVDSAVDSGSDNEGFEAPEDDMIDGLHLDGPDQLSPFEIRPLSYTFGNYFSVVVICLLYR